MKSWWVRVEKRDGGSALIAGDRWGFGGCLVSLRGETFQRFGCYKVVKLRMRRMASCAASSAEGENSTGYWGSEGG